MSDLLEALYQYGGVVISALLFVIIVIGIVRIIIKKRRGEDIEITPVGVRNDLPDSVTGLNKYEDALDITNQKKEE